MQYWEDRVTEEQAQNIMASLARYKRSRKTRQDRDVLYEGLTANGITSEEADEMVHLERNGE